MNSCRKIFGIAQSVDHVDHETAAQTSHMAVWWESQWWYDCRVEGHVLPHGEQPYLQRARTAVTSFSCKCLESLDHVTFAMKTSRWLEGLSILFQSLASVGWKYWFTNLLNMVGNSNEICRKGFWAQPNSTFWLFCITMNFWESIASDLNINVCSKNCVRDQLRTTKKSHAHDLQNPNHSWICHHCKFTTFCLNYNAFRLNLMTINFTNIYTQSFHSLSLKWSFKI